MDQPCVTVEGTTVTGHKCKVSTKQYCPITYDGAAETCKNKSFPAGIKRLAGDKCYKESDCLSNQQKNGYCLGKAAGTACTDHSECDVGLICTDQGSTTKTCKPAKKDKE